MTGFKLQNDFSLPTLCHRIIAPPLLINILTHQNIHYRDHYGWVAMKLRSTHMIKSKLVSEVKINFRQKWLGFYRIVSGIRTWNAVLWSLFLFLQEFSQGRTDSGQSSYVLRISVNVTLCWLFQQNKATGSAVVIVVYLIISFFIAALCALFAYCTYEKVRCYSYYWQYI